MARKPTGNPTGRPYREYDQKSFERLCHVHCPVDEIEFIMHTDQRTLDAWCQRTYGEDLSTTYKRFSSTGKSSIRINQFHLSKTNAGMAIWLGKILLGQKDPDQEETKKYSQGIYENIKKILIDKQNDNSDTISKASSEPSGGDSPL